jgi:hypothetical protein
MRKYKYLVISGLDDMIFATTIDASHALVAEGASRSVNSYEAPRYTKRAEGCPEQRYRAAAVRHS